jgi:hypothetical protein
MVKKPEPCPQEADMFSYLQMFKSRAVLTLAAAFLVAAPGLANAQTTGTVRIKVNKYGVIVGTSGGQGVLVFKGKEYPLRLDGISAGMIGASRTNLAGTASNLRTAADIAGSYTAVGAGAALRGAGGRTVRLRSDKGVILKLHGTALGYGASAEVSRVTISLR